MKGPSSEGSFFVDIDIPLEVMFCLSETFR